MRGSRAVAFAFLALALAQIVLGVAWGVANLGKIPHYGDTRELLRTARTLEFVEGRTIGYPWLLRGLHGAIASAAPWGETDDWETAELEPSEPVECVAPAWHGAVQVLQVAVLACALVWAIRAVTGSSRRSIVVALLVTTDPWVLHHAFSVMTDSLSLSLLALTCGVWVRLLRSGGAAWCAALVALHVANALLRYEKNLVLAAGAAGVALGAFLVVRWDAARSRPDGLGAARTSVRRRALLGLALSLAAVPIAHAIDTLRDPRPELFSPSARILHSRIIYPRLGEVVDELSEGTRALLTPDIVEKYDRGALLPIGILETIAADDPELVEELAFEIAPIVWKHHAGAIVADVIGDVLKYMVPAPVFYARLGVWLSLDERRPMMVTRRPYEAAAVHHLLRKHEPIWSTRLEVTGALLTGFGLLGLLVTALRNVRRSRALFDPDNAVRWLPVVAILFANAAAFSLAVDLFEIRYGLPAHVALLALAYGGLWSWSVSRARGA